MLGRQLAAPLSGPDKTREIADRGAIVGAEIAGQSEIQIAKGNFAKLGRLLYQTNIQESKLVVSKNLL
jgi:hypothetical protein